MSLMNNGNNGQLPASGFNLQTNSNYPADSNTTYLSSSQHQPPSSLSYPQAHPLIPTLPTAPFPVAAYQTAPFESMKNQGQGDVHGYPSRYPPTAYPRERPGPLSQDYSNFAPQTDFQAQAIQLTPSMDNLPTSMYTTFRQYSMANSRSQVVPPMINLAGYPDLAQVERSVRPSNSSAASYATNTAEQKLSVYEKIKSALKISQIFPKREDIKENSQIEVPEQGIPSSWCHVSYYEMNERVGEPYKGSGEHMIIDGLCAPSDGFRFCLGILSNANRNPVCVATRKQIGRGCHIFKDGNDIYLESLSESPMFVQAPLYAEFNKDNLATVYRLPQNMRIKVFDKPTFQRLVAEASAAGYNSVYTLLAMCTLRISFVKGWGEQYRRQTITACPCWLEVQLPGPLQVLDKILMTLGGPLNDEIHSFT